MNNLLLAMLERVGVNTIDYAQYDAAVGGLLAMLERVGVNTDRFGDATGTLPLEPLSGV